MQVLSSGIMDQMIFPPVKVMNHRSAGQDTFHIVGFDDQNLVIGHGKLQMQAIRDRIRVVANRLN